MKNPKTTQGECESPEKPPQDCRGPEPPPALQNGLGPPEQTDVRAALARMLQAASHIRTQLLDLSSLVHTAQHRAGQLGSTLRDLHRGSTDLQMKIQKLQGSRPAPVQSEEVAALRAPVPPAGERPECQAGEHRECQAGELAAARTPAAQPSPDRARPVVIDVEEAQPCVAEVSSPSCVVPAPRPRGVWTLRSFTDHILQLPKILKHVADAVMDDNFALPCQANDELVEVVVLP